MASNKLSEARVFKTWAAEAAHPDLVLKTTEKGGWIRPGLAKNDHLSLTQHDSLSEERKTAQQKDIPSLALAGLLGITLIPALLGIALKEERKGALTFRRTYRCWVAYSQWTRAPLGSVKT